MQPIEYKPKVIKAINSLTTSQIELFTSIVNIGMAGELKDLEFEEGDDVDFELAHFDDSNDVNVQTLVDLYKQMEQAKQSLINLNAISEDDLDIILPNE